MRRLRPVGEVAGRADRGAPAQSLQIDRVFVDLLTAFNTSSRAPTEGLAPPLAATSQRRSPCAAPTPHFSMLMPSPPRPTCRLSNRAAAPPRRNVEPSIIPAANRGSLRPSHHRRLSDTSPGGTRNRRHIPRQLLSAERRRHCRHPAGNTRWRVPASSARLFDDEAFDPALLKCLQCFSGDVRCCQERCTRPSCRRREWALGPPAARQGYALHRVPGQGLDRGPPDIEPSSLAAWRTLPRHRRWSCERRYRHAADFEQLHVAEASSSR